ncbi:MAG: hypothetical protein D3909_02415, partial [Candidatus Electrothrix sp. ATG1]|nr:hypothetical protein [Candidatus Electrothrix sp. ATG1]
LSDLRQRIPVRPARFLVPLNRINISQLDQFGDKIRKYSSRILWCLPPILHEADLDWTGQEIRKLSKKGYTRFSLGHYSQYGLFLPLIEGQDEFRPELYGNYTLNLLNSAALQATAHLGYQGVLFSLESEGDNLASALHHYTRQSRGQSTRQRGKGNNEETDLPPRIQVGVYAYGHPPLFTARLDSTHFRYHQSLVSPQDEYFRLENKDGLTTARALLPFSLLKQRQELTSMGVDFLLDLSSGAINREATTLNTLLSQGEPRRTGRDKQPLIMRGNFDGVLV